MVYIEGKYVSGGKEKPYLYEIYDWEKIKREIAQRELNKEISRIIEQGFSEDADLSEILETLGQRGFYNELQEIRTTWIPTSNATNV